MRLVPHSSGYRGIRHMCRGVSASTPRSRLHDLQHRSLLIVVHGRSPISGYLMIIIIHCWHGMSIHFFKILDLDQDFDKCE